MPPAPPPPRGGGVLKSSSLPQRLPMPPPLLLPAPPLLEPPMDGRRFFCDIRRRGSGVGILRLDVSRTEAGASARLTDAGVGSMSGAASAARGHPNEDVSMLLIFTLVLAFVGGKACAAPRISSEAEESEETAVSFEESECDERFSTDAAFAEDTSLLKQLGMLLFPLAGESACTTEPRQRANTRRRARAPPAG